MAATHHALVLEIDEDVLLLVSHVRFSRKDRAGGSARLTSEGQRTWDAASVAFSAPSLGAVGHGGTEDEQHAEV